MALKTNYVDDVLNTSKNTKRKYNMVNNADGTVSLDDVTVYSKTGTAFGATDVNATNKAVNNLTESLTANDGLNFRFAVDGEGNHGYLGADDSFIPFSQGGFKSSVTMRIYPQADGYASGQRMVVTPDSMYSINGISDFSTDEFDFVFGKSGAYSFKIVAKKELKNVRIVLGDVLRTPYTPAVDITKNFNASEEYKIVGKTDTWYLLNIIV